MYIILEAETLRLEGVHLRLRHLRLTKIDSKCFEQFPKIFTQFLRFSENYMYLIVDFEILIVPPKGV
jgi:hypothetical protein